VEVERDTDWVSAYAPSEGLKAGAATVFAGGFGVEGQFTSTMQRAKMDASRVKRAMKRLPVDTFSVPGLLRGAGSLPGKVYQQGKGLSTQVRTDNISSE
jgi:hypothetical protein